MNYRRNPDAPEWKNPIDITGRLTEYLKPKSKYGHIKKGDRVICKIASFQYRRYFSHETNGCAYCFNGGSDEWSSMYETTKWDDCELWDGSNG